MCLAISSRSCNVGQIIRSLDVLVDEKSPFVSVLKACPCLYELKLSINIHELNPEQYDALGDISSIRALTIEQCPVMSRLPLRILQHLPGLRFLRLMREIFALPPREPPRFALYELSYRRTPREPTLEWLLSSGRTSLEILEVWETPSVSVKAFLRERGPALRSLRLSNYAPPWIPSLRSCTRLEELKIWMLPTMIMLDSLPASIEHIGFSNHGRDPLTVIIQAVPVLPKLRMITYDKLSEGLTDFKDLEAACSKAGVVMRLEHFPFWNVCLPI